MTMACYPDTHLNTPHWMKPGINCNERWDFCIERTKKAVKSPFSTHFPGWFSRLFPLSFLGLFKSGFGLSEGWRMKKQEALNQRPVKMAGEADESESGGHPLPGHLIGIEEAKSQIHPPKNGQGLFRRAESAGPIGNQPVAGRD